LIMLTNKLVFICKEMRNQGSIVVWLWLKRSSQLDTVIRYGSEQHGHRSLWPRQGAISPPHFSRVQNFYSLY